MRGDILSYVTSNNAAVRRLSAMLGEFALADLQDVAETIVNQSLEATRAEIARLPQGSWSSTLVIDGYDAPVTLRATLTIDGSRVLVDYAGSDACLPRGINVVLNYARAYTVFALRCVISPEVPNNHGALLPYEVEAPEGSILNVQRPWPVAARHIVGQMLPDLVFGCLSQAIPDRVPVEGSSCLWSVQLRGRHPSSEQGAPGELFDTIFFNSGGSGARPGQDGLDGTAFPSGVRAMPVEVTEHGAPIVIWRKELLADRAAQARCAAASVSAWKWPCAMAAALKFSPCSSGSRMPRAGVTVERTDRWARCVYRTAPCCAERVARKSRPAGGWCSMCPAGAAGVIRMAARPTRWRRISRMALSPRAPPAAFTGGPDALRFLRRFRPRAVRSVSHFFLSYLPWGVSPQRDARICPVLTGSGGARLFLREGTGIVRSKAQARSGVPWRLSHRPCGKGLGSGR